MLPVAGLAHGRRGHLICPLIALMKNQVDVMRTFSAERDRAFPEFVPEQGRCAGPSRCAVGMTKLLYFAPESLTKEENVAFPRRSTFRSTPWTRLIASPSRGMTSGPSTAGSGRSSTRSDRLRHRLTATATPEGAD